MARGKPAKVQQDALNSAREKSPLENIANALEVIEIEVPKDISLRFIHLFEPGNLEEKFTALQSNFKEELRYETIIDEILHNQKHYFHRWTRAAALHSLQFYRGKEKHHVRG